MIMDSLIPPTFLLQFQKLNEWQEGLLCSDNTLQSLCKFTCWLLPHASKAGSYCFSIYIQLTKVPYNIVQFRVQTTFEKWGGLASRIEFVGRDKSRNYIFGHFKPLIFVYVTLLITFFSSLAFLNFGRPFAVTACTHNNMSLKIWGEPLPTPLQLLGMQSQI